MGKSGCLPPGSCRWLVQFKNSMNARMAKFKNDFRRKFFRDNKHLGQLRADQLHNETGTRDMEITKQMSKPAADSSVPKQKVVKKSTNGYQPSLYAEEASPEIQRTQVVKNSNDENNRNSSPNCRDEFVTTVIRNSVAHLIKEASVAYLMKDSAENLLKRNDSNVETTGKHVIKDTDTTNQHVVIDTDTTNEHVVIDTDITNEKVAIDTDTTKEQVVIDTDTTNERVVIDTDTTNEHVVIDTDTNNECVIIDTETTNEQVVIDTDTTNERVVVDTDNTNERVVIDTATANEHVVIDTDTTHERVVIDTDNTNERVVIDTDIIKESNAMNIIKASSEIVLKEQGDNFDICYEQVVKETDNVSVSSSVLSAFAESAVKASLFEKDVVDNVNQSAMVPTSAVKARRSPRTVKEFLEMIGVPDCRDSSSLHLPDVDI
ncbi:uncharacterized protein LOC127882081 isoform X2 [Dreissena polymorpha]|uniref:uncharacterized protein LOC127882081 isoform X2 n=1 Tax=Dreissena polymorpha TaxID=45954 RepID=UPI00226412C8|nr:uncharacterized protein LOC127882081 isoform X2 [Dreissena polymorpha]